MKHEEFRLERYMSQYEFSARHLLAGSDCESYPMAEVVSWADDECRELWEALRLGYTESPGSSSTVMAIRTPSSGTTSRTSSGETPW